MQRPRVLVSGPSPPPEGGISAVIETIVRSDLAKHFELDTFDTTYPRWVARGALEKATNRVLSRAIGLDAAWNLEARAVLERFREALTVRPDLVHCHCSHGFDFWLSIRMISIARARGIASILHTHGLFDVVLPRWSRAKRFLFGRALRRPDRIVVLSDGWRRWFARYAPVERLTRLHNPVDVRRFAAPNEPRRSSGPLRLLFVGTAHATRKGAYEILAAVPSVVAAIPDVRFVFVGSDREQLFERRVRGTPFESHFEFAGPKDTREIAPYFETADLLLLPSHAEGLPIALLEGMAAGLPVVACPVNAIPEVIREPENGLFAAPGDPASLARAILRLAGDAGLRMRMGAANRAKAVREFDQSLFASALGTIYSSTIAEHRRRHGSARQRVPLRGGLAPPPEERDVLPSNGS
jgi:glycosyltransferase involved in cell wall biosynthesis